MTTRRKFIQGAAIAAPAALATPALAQSTIKWRMQTYAGASLAAEVIVPAIDMFNKIAGDRMQIELFFADQLAGVVIEGRYGELMFDTCVHFSPRDQVRVSLRLQTGLLLRLWRKLANHPR